MSNGRCDADPSHPPFMGFKRPYGPFGAPCRKKAKDLVGARLGLVKRALVLQRPREIDERQFAAAASDFEPKGVQAFGIDRYWHGWLCDLTFLCFATCQVGFTSGVFKKSSAYRFASHIFLILVYFYVGFRGILMDLFLREATARIWADVTLAKIDALMDWPSPLPIFKLGLG
jgi:hypothetical protein